MRILAHVDTGFVNAEHTDTYTIPDKDIAGMTEEEIDKHIRENYVEPMIDSYIDAWYEVIEE